MEEGTVGEAEVFTEAAVGEGFMAAVEGSTAGEAAFTEEEDFPAEGVLVSAADIRLAGIGAADFMGDAATTVVAAMDGAAEVGAMVVMDSEEAGAGDLAMAGRIGDGDIRMATTATARITLILTIPTRPTAPRKTT
jgi:hypothetical protein